MKLYHYETVGGKDLIMDYIRKLSKPEKADGLSVLEKLEEERFDELTIKTWRGKILEVYFYKHNRIFYVIVEDTNAYLLHAYRKQKNETENTDSDLIIARAKRLGEKLSKNFI